MGHALTDCHCRGSERAEAANLARPEWETAEQYFEITTVHPWHEAR